MGRGLLADEESPNRNRPRKTPHHRTFTEKLLKLLLSDLETIRIVCRQCKAAVEVPIDRLSNAADILCPGCPPTGKTVLRPAKGSDLANLAAAIIRLKQAKDVEIEFVVPEKEDRPNR
jgi:hypothetical protein